VLIHQPFGNRVFILCILKEHFFLLILLAKSNWTVGTCKTFKTGNRLVVFEQTIQRTANSIDSVVTVIAFLQCIHLILSDVFVFICSEVGQSWQQAIQLHSNQYLSQKTQCISINFPQYFEVYNPRNNSLSAPDRKGIGPRSFKIYNVWLQLLNSFIILFNYIFY